MPTKKPTRPPTELQVSKALQHRRPIGDQAGPSGRVASVQRMYDLDPRVVADTLKNLHAALGTKRDKRSHSFYDFPATLTRQDLENMFRSSWLMKRIVKTPADDMTRAWVELNWDDSDKRKDDVRAIEVAEKTFRLRQAVKQWIMWSRLYGGAGIILDIKGQEDWSKPLDVTTVQKGQLRSLHVLDRWRLAATGQVDYDRRSPNYGYPEFYTISDQGDPRFSVHHTRVVRGGGEPLPYFLFTQNAYWEDSVLQHIAEVIRDYDATMAGIASLVYEANVDIVTSPKLANTLAEKNGRAKVEERYLLMAMMKSINHMMLLDGGNGTKESVGEQYTQKTTQFSGLKDVAEKFMINVCGAADIPMTRLFGQSPAGLTATGESDIRNYYDRISADQESILRPGLERIYEVLVRSTLGDMPKNFQLSFKPLWQMSDKERAEIEKLNAERDQINTTAGIVPHHAATNELLERGTYRGLTKDDVAMVEAMEEKRALGPGGPTPPAAPKAGDPAHGEEDVGGGEGGGEGGHAGDSDPASVCDIIRKESNGWNVYSENGAKHLGGPYKKKAQAIKRLAQVEYFKNA